MPSLKSINRLRFLKNNDERKEKIKEAPLTPLPKDYPVNQLSYALHPEIQHVVVSEIKEWNKDCKSLTFQPVSPTKELAFFKAGSYICVYLEKDGMKLSRPYSLSSSPQEALDGSYTITVKRVPGGKASEYLLDKVKVGDTLKISGPLGEFVYLPIRDGKTVIGIAGGSGITPFHSFAKAIREGHEDFQLILFYGSRTEEDILFKEDFDTFQKEDQRIKVIHVLSDEKKEGYEHGFVNASLIKKYLPSNDYSVFLCGPEGMIDFLDKEIQSLHLERKWIRHELQGEIHHPEKQPDYPQKEIPETVSITVHICDETKTIQASSKETILQSLENHGISAPSRCRSGECGWCHSLLMKGEVYCPKSREHRREADFSFNYIHPCCTFPLSDIEIEVPYDPFQSL